MVEWGFLMIVFDLLFIGESGGILCNVVFGDINIEDF